MSKGIFTDKRKKPGLKEIEAAVGRALMNWKELNDFLTAAMKLKGEWKFYGVNYGWAIRYAKSGKSVVALYPDKDGFTAQVILKRPHVEAAFAKGVSAATKDAVNRATDFKEGRWVFVHVDPKTGTDDVVTLVNARLGVG
jgi:hypothetical protein